jgi:hypothetical protein
MELASWAKRSLETKHSILNYLVMTAYGLLASSSAAANAWWASAPLVAVAVDKRDLIMSTECHTNLKCGAVLSGGAQATATPL